MADLWYHKKYIYDVILKYLIFIGGPFIVYSGVNIVKSRMSPFSTSLMFDDNSIYWEWTKKEIKFLRNYTKLLNINIFMSESTLPCRYKLTFKIYWKPLFETLT